MPDGEVTLEHGFVGVGEGRRRGLNARQGDEALGAAAGVSVRTVRGWVSRYGDTTQRGAQRRVRLYHKVHARLRARWIKDWLAKREGDAEHHTMVAALAAWQAQGVVLPNPGDVDALASAIEARGGPPPDMPAVA